MPSNHLQICLEKIRKKIDDEPWYLSKILYPDYEFKDFHEKWFYDALTPEEDLCLGPRKSAKTTVKGMSYIYKMAKNPNIRLGISSDTEGQAIHFASEIKLQCENNKILTALYPQLMPTRRWSEKEFIIAGADKIQKGSTVTAFGYSSSITGYEFDDILIDDVVDLENSRTQYQRDKLENWIGMTCIPMLVRGGVIKWNGTRYHADDMYGRLLERGVKYNKGTNKAILDNGESYWPEVWSIEKLLDIKSKIGSMRFNAQYQNDVTLMKQGSIFKREWFNYFKKDGEYYVLTNGKRIPIKDIAFYQTCDLALSKKETADYFVILTFGVDKEGNIYITNLLRGRFSWAEQKRLTPEHYRRNTPLNWLGIESNQYQAVLADEMNTLTDISIRKLDPVGDKVTRANSMSAKFETGKVFIWNKLPQLDEFEDELTKFPEGEHDDMVDCVGYIPQCIRKKRPKVYVNV